MKLEDLPKEVLVNAFLFLEWDFLYFEIRIVCNYFHVIIENDIGLWKTLCEIKFEDYRIRRIKNRLDMKEFSNDPLRKNWNEWRVIFERIERPISKLFVKKVVSRVEELKKDADRTKNSVGLFSDISLFADLSCRKCKDLRLPSFGWGDFEIVGYFIPRKDPSPEELEDQGFSSFIRKNLEMLLPSSELEEVKKHISEEMDKFPISGKKKRQRVRLMRKLRIEYREKYPKLFGIGYMNIQFKDPPVVMKKGSSIFKSHKPVTKKQYDEYFSNPERKMEDFVDFVSKCFLKRFSTCDWCKASDISMWRKEEMKWSEVMKSFSENLDAKFFVPMYSDEIKNVCYLSYSGNDSQVCVEGENGYYFFRMWTS